MIFLNAKKKYLSENFINQEFVTLKITNKNIEKFTTFFFY